MVQIIIKFELIPREFISIDHQRLFWLILETLLKDENNLSFEKSEKFPFNHYSFCYMGKIPDIKMCPVSFTPLIFLCIPLHLLYTFKNLNPQWKSFVSFPDLLQIEELSQISQIRFIKKGGGSKRLRVLTKSKKFRKVSKLYQKWCQDSTGNANNDNLYYQYGNAYYMPDAHHLYHQIILTVSTTTY